MARGSVRRAYGDRDGLAPRLLALAGVLAAAVSFAIAPPVVGKEGRLSEDAAGASATPTSHGSAAGSPRRGGAIAFASERDGRSSIYAINSDGTGLRLLVRNATRPAWSPDGKRLAFVREEPERSAGLYVVEVPGGRERRLASDVVGSSLIYHVSWSPDSSTIAFALGSSIHTVTADGSKVRSIASGYVGNPVWSPDGTRIAYIKGDPGELRVVEAKGGGDRRIRSDVCNSGAPPAHGWSPDGRLIAYVDSDYQLVVVNSDGSARRRLTQSGNCVLAWSPDGKRIAFSSGGLHVIGRDGSRDSTVGRNQVSPITLSWSPDGREIATDPNRPEPPDIWVTSSVRPSERRLTSGTGYPIGFPHWHPRGVRAESLGGKPVGSAVPTDSVARGNTLHTKSPIGLLAADGARAAIAFTAARTCLELWSPASGTLTRIYESTCAGVEGIRGMALADSRLAWSTYFESNHFYWDLLTATIGRPRPVTLLSTIDGGEFEGFAGDGSLLVFAWWRENEESGDFVGTTLYRIVGNKVVRIRTDRGRERVLAAGGGRIAVAREDGVIDLVLASGSVDATVRPDSQQLRGAALDGERLALMVGGSLMVYDVRNGRLLDRRAVRNAVQLVDLERGLALVELTRGARLLRLSDGRSLDIRMARSGLVDLEPAGLFYVEANGGGRRVRFVPFAKLLAGLR